MGLFDIPDPVNYINEVKDEKLKQAAITLAQSQGYSQYITFLYMLGKQLQGKRLIGWLGPVFTAMAASSYTLLMEQDVEKVVYTAVPIAMVKDTALMDSIHYEKEKQK